jgi:hypothetical protein
VDLIGPWIVQVRGIPHTFDALTVIDTVTNLVEIFRVDCKTSDHVMRKFAQCWLTRYPWPQGCIHDPGGEFTGPKFQTLLLLDILSHLWREGYLSRQYILVCIALRNGIPK